MVTKKAENQVFPVFRKLHAIFSSEDRRRVCYLFFPMVLAAIVNVMGIAFVAPFIAIVANPNTIKVHKKIAWLYHAMHFTSTHKFLLFLGGLVLAILILGNGIGALTTWLMLRFTNLRSFTISKRLLEKYLKQPYTYFLNKNGAVLTKNILSEVDVVVAHIIRHGLEMMAKMVAMAFIVVLLIFVNPSLAAAVVVVLGGAYVTIYAFVRRRLGEVSHVHVKAKEQRYRIVSEAFGGIKEVKLQGSERYFLNAYSEPAHRFASHEASAQIISDLPRYALEVIAFGGILLIVLYLLATHHSFGDIMPLLALYAFAGYRLMPGLQSIFGALTSIKAHTTALDVLYEDLVTRRWSSDSTNQSNESTVIVPLPLKKQLSLRDVSFVYPESEQMVLQNINLDIQAGETVGFVGETGAGKTTVVDIILGLLQPVSGELIVDGVTVNTMNARQWQCNLGYVPQHIYLSDDTVSANIAFGLDHNTIDFKKVEQAAKMASIHEFISTELSDGYNTCVGERGIRLSGGQRQRLGIARALYRDPALLVFDEATSALDSMTEENIMQSIYSLSRKKTLIIVAHRLSTLMACDKIFVLAGGAVQGVGTYHELISDNLIFQRLAKVDRQAVRNPDSVSVSPQ